MQEQTPQDILIDAINAEDPDTINRALDALHPSEIADLLESLPKKDRTLIWEFIPHNDRGDVLSHAQDPVRAGLLEQMPPEEVADVTKSLDADDIADILNDLPESVVDDVLFSMDIQDRQRLASVLSYSEDSAGGLMNPDIISVRADVTLDVVSRYLRQKGQLPDQTVSLMVVDRENSYLGVLRLIDVLTKSPDATVGEFLDSGVKFPADDPAREVARVFEQRDIFSAAVVDVNNKLLGVITVDDVLDVIQEQAEQTMRNMDGLVDDDMFSPLLVSARYRALWLGINLMAAFLASYVVGRFEETIQQLVALAVLMPVVASMGGVAGSQALNITIRGLSTGQITKVNSGLLINKEVGVGILNGLTWALVVAVVAIFWFDNYALGAIIGLAMVINLIVAAYSGVVIPLFLKKIGIDPAIAGGVLLITVTDVVGFATFLGLATFYLKG